MKRGPKKKSFSGSNQKTEKPNYQAVKRSKPSLSFKEVEELLRSCETPLEKALIELGLTTGIRRSDIVNIQIANIDLEGSRIKFWEEKKDRWWEVALEPETVVTLRIYMSTLDPRQKDLFDISDRTAYNYLQNVLKRTTIKKKLKFHSLRTTFVRLSKEMGRDIRWVMDQTGDTARVLMEEYEGYSVDEMVYCLDKDGILKRSLSNGQSMEELIEIRKKLLDELDRIDNIIVRKREGNNSHISGMESEDVRQSTVLQTNEEVSN